MLTILSHNWWVVALRGVAAVILGILTLLFPGLALLTLVSLFGIYALIDGISMAIISIQHRQETYWWVHLLEGLVGILAGILTIMYPDITSLILLYIIASWAVLTGLFEIWAAVQLRKAIQGELWLGLGGVISILFGFLLILSPSTGALAVLTIIGIYAIAFGVVLLILSFRLRGISQQNKASA
jgi:uncharacterized membrane protein HdeD (DUF308 family)